MFRAIVLSFAVTLTATGYSADGPENTGAFTLKKPTDHTIETHLQIDNKIFNATFGDQAENPIEQIARLISLEASGVACKAGEPAIVANNDVLSAVIEFVCPVMANQLKINLIDATTLPPGFTLGVRTPIDHFVLTAANPAAETIVSTEYLFFRAGLGYVFGSRLLDTARLGRPHALFYGGLVVVPQGIWLLILILLIFSSRLEITKKIVVGTAALGITAVTSWLILSKGASLSLMPVRQLGFTYLASLIAIGILNIWNARKYMFAATLMLVLVAALFSGAEQAVVLRWLEGQPEIGLAGVLTGFYGGAGIAMSGICAVLLLLTSLAAGKLKHRGFTAGQALTGVNSLLILLLLYPALAMFLKII